MNNKRGPKSWRKRSSAKLRMSNICRKIITPARLIPFLESNPAWMRWYCFRV